MTSGSKRCLPQLFDLLMYLQEERYRGRTMYSPPYIKKPIVQLLLFGTGWRVPLEPRKAWQSTLDPTLTVPLSPRTLVVTFVTFTVAVPASTLAQNYPCATLDGRHR